MIEMFSNLSHITQAVIASMFTWGITMIGASVVFFFKEIKKSIMDALLGFAAGVMIAASFWSLLNPAIDMAGEFNVNVWIVFLGFFAGGLLLFMGDKLYTLLAKKKSIKDDKFKRCAMLIFSITLHNIPEGLVIGVAFGSLAYGLEGATLASAVALAIGIGLQNLPEGSAVSLPLRREGLSRSKAFIYGELSGIVEPISAIIGAILVLKIQTILPFLLSFAAGAMIYVVVEELIPESQSNERKDIMALFTLVGFSVMMILDVLLG